LICVDETESRSLAVDFRAFPTAACARFSQPAIRSSNPRSS
jgi:hypothetical protein